MRREREVAIVALLADESGDGYLSHRQTPWFALLIVEEFWPVVLKDMDEHSPRFYAKIVSNFNTPVIFRIFVSERRNNVRYRVHPRFCFGSENWNWSENFVSLGSEKKAWFRLIHIEAKKQKSEAKTNVK